MKKRITLTLPKELVEKIEKESKGNKSYVVEKALEFYFEYKKVIKSLYGK